MTTAQRLTPNQLVAYNLARARKLKGWTQEQAATALEQHLGERWSKATWSAAERSFDGSRIRQFSADEIVAFSCAFNLPISWWLLPPDLVNATKAQGSQNPGLAGEDLLVYLFPVEAELLEPLQRRLKDLFLGEVDGVTQLDRIRSSELIPDGLIKVVQLQIEAERQQADRRLQRMIDDAIKANLAKMKETVRQEFDRLVREPESEVGSADDAVEEEGGMHE